MKNCDIGITYEIFYNVIAINVIHFGAYFAYIYASVDASVCSCIQDYMFLQ